MDFAIFAGALLPIFYRAYSLDLLPALLDAHHLLSPRWWACILGLSLLYALHAFIWNFPVRFMHLCGRIPLRLLGAHPVGVFATCEILGKFWQFSVCAAYAGHAGMAAAAASLGAAPAWCWAVFGAYMLVGQGLNAAIYAAIGNDGVYYGFKLGRPVPWCDRFPFNVGLRHPQYVGVVLTILGALLLLTSAPVLETGLVHAGLAWATMYVLMAAMEQMNDNDASDDSKGKVRARGAPPSSPNTVIRPESKFSEDALSIVTWFYNLVGPTLRGRPACKPTMPGVIPTVIAELKHVMGPLHGASDWTFVDLGCGQGMMLQPMRDALVEGGQPLFRRVVGVELDPVTHKEAVRAHSDPAIEVVCDDMFPFVERACAHAKIYGGRAAFYIYEPLWMANLSEAEMDKLYGGLLDAISKHPEAVIVYCSADAYREMKTSLLVEKGFVLRRAVQVAQNGAFNKIRGVYNPLELWQVPSSAGGR